MASKLDELLSESKVTQTEVAVALGLDSSTISRKVGGARPWKQQEIQALIAFLAARLGRPVSYEELFGPADEPAADLVAPEGEPA